MRKQQGYYQTSKAKAMSRDATCSLGSHQLTRIQFYCYWDLVNHLDRRLGIDLRLIFQSSSYLLVVVLDYAILPTN